jgi:hypothetical protein
MHSPEWFLMFFTVLSHSAEGNRNIRRGAATRKLVHEVSIQSTSTFSQLLETFHIQVTFVLLQL